MMAGVEPTTAPIGCDRMNSIRRFGSVVRKYGASVAAWLPSNETIVPSGSTVKMFRAAAAGADATHRRTGVVGCTKR